MTDTPTPAEQLHRLGTVIAATLRQVLAITGVDPDALPESVDDVATDVARHHLDAMAEAWDHGYVDAGGRVRSAGEPNPYRKLIDDRREFVREQVTEGYGTQVDENDNDVLGDDNAGWFDAVLDAHDQWLTLQSRGYCRAALHRVGAGDPPGGVPCSLTVGHRGKHITASGRAWGDVTDQQQRNIAELFAKVRADAAAGNRYTVAIDGIKLAPTDDEGFTDVDRAVESLTIRAEQAEARVAELDGVLGRLAGIAKIRPGQLPVEDGLDGVRDVLTRAGYGEQPGGWVPPYSADEALRRIWNVLTTQLTSPVYKLNGVRDVLADMG